MTKFPFQTEPEYDYFHGTELVSVDSSYECLRSVFESWYRIRFECNTIPSFYYRKKKQVEESNDFEIWWEREGSAIRPLPEHDHEEHAKRIAEIAWQNGKFKK